MKKLSSICLVLAALSLSSCGSGNDPTAVLSDPSAAPNFFMPFSDSVSSTITGFSATHTSYEWVSFGTEVTVTAPGSGLVTSVSGSVGTTTVTVAFNARIGYELDNLDSANVHAGDQVGTGSTIGQAKALKFTVFDNGVASCPLSYLGSDG